MSLFPDRECGAARPDHPCRHSGMLDPAGFRIRLKVRVASCMKTSTGAARTNGALYDRPFATSTIGVPSRGIKSTRKFE